MMENKKTWVEPELIVLVRSKPEESVLNACKGGPGQGTSGQGWGMCESMCSECYDIGAS